MKAKELIAATLEKEEKPATDGQDTTSGDISVSTPSPAWRACAICVKDLALPDPEGFDEDNELADQLGRIKLRERKAIERKVEREAREARKAKKSTGEKDGNGDDDDNDDSNKNPAESESDVDSAGDVDDDEDPFLAAVGGADKLLTGKEYQEKLLKEMQQRDQET